MLQCLKFERSQNKGFQILCSAFKAVVHTPAYLKSGFSINHGDHFDLSLRRSEVSWSEYLFSFLPGDWWHPPPTFNVLYTPVHQNKFIFICFVSLAYKTAWKCFSSHVLPCYYCSGLRMNTEECWESLKKKTKCRLLRILPKEQDPARTWLIPREEIETYLPRVITCYEDDFFVFFSRLSSYQGWFIYM